MSSFILQHVYRGGTSTQFHRLTRCSKFLREYHVNYSQLNQGKMVANSKVLSNLLFFTSRKDHFSRTKNQYILICRQKASTNVPKTYSWLFAQSIWEEKGSISDVASFAPKLLCQQICIPVGYIPPTLVAANRCQYWDFFCSGGFCLKGDPLPPVDRMTDICFWNHYLTPNFFCGL